MEDQELKHLTDKELFDLADEIVATRDPQNPEAQEYFRAVMDELGQRLIQAEMEDRGNGTTH